MTRLAKYFLAAAVTAAAFLGSSQSVKAADIVVTPGYWDNYWNWYDGQYRPYYRNYRGYRMYEQPRYYNNYRGYRGGNYYYSTPPRTGMNAGPLYFEWR